MGEPVKLCACGQPAHPVYGDRCEDCWCAGQPTLSRTEESRSKIRTANNVRTLRNVDVEPTKNK